MMTLPFTSPSGLPTQNSLFTFSLINTVNGNDPVASADIVQINNFAAPLNFTDAAGNQYFLETTFKVDQSTIDNSLSTYDQFRVFEGSTGSATLVGRVTVSPVPEPGSLALLVVAGLIIRCRRRPLRALA